MICQIFNGPGTTYVDAIQPFRQETSEACRKMLNAFIIDEAKKLRVFLLNNPKICFFLAVKRQKDGVEVLDRLGDI